ncbi:MAG: HupE/UreJ family protein [Pseudohongiella sp.]|nr:HupE/UreJ family protein [Pseudohongiella sp.]MDP2126069.1 HupE/UreJ family protein [Pseudohongiella sp.]
MLPTSKTAVQAITVLLIVLGMMLLPSLSFAHDMTDIARDRMAAGGFLNVMWTGAEHMLSGYDHLLFLLGVMFFLTRLRDIFLFVTAFTLGHTVTLIFATFAGISANHYLIDAVIAVTVAYKGFENLDGFKRWFGFNAPNLLAMVFIFGLIHGFGLSARLQAVTLADDPDLLGKILIFNLGVEVGQIIALMIMAVAIRSWQQVKAWPQISKACNTALVIAGFGLLIFQMDGYFDERQQRSAPAFEVFTDIDQVMGRLVPAADSAARTEVADLEIRVLNRNNQQVEFLRTDGQGWFAFSGDSTATYQLTATDTLGRTVQTEVVMGAAAQGHVHEEGIHIPFYLYIALLMLLSAIPARRLAMKQA